MKKPDHEVLATLTIIVIMSAFLAFIVIAGCYGVEQTAYKDGYKAACQDFYNGTLKAELVDPKTNEWKMK